METKTLSERGKRRLRLAAGLPAERQAALKTLVDWVEDYDRASAAQALTSARGS